MIILQCYNGFHLIQPTIAIDGNVKRVFSRITNKSENKIDFNKLIEINKKTLFKTKKLNFLSIDGIWSINLQTKRTRMFKCNIKNTCEIFKSDKKFKQTKELKQKKKIIIYFAILIK